jgi:hypothetical protein
MSTNEIIVALVNDGWQITFNPFQAGTRANLVTATRGMHRYQQAYAGDGGGLQHAMEWLLKEANPKTA